MLICIVVQLLVSLLAIKQIMRASKNVRMFCYKMQVIVNKLYIFFQSGDF